MKVARVAQREVVQTKAACNTTDTAAAPPYPNDTVEDSRSASPADELSRHGSSTKRQLIKACGGYLFAFGTLAMSFYYLELLSGTLTNDLWWPSFNATGPQSYLADMVNFLLIPTSAGNATSWTFDLFGTGFVKDYSRSATLLAFPPTYARAILGAKYTDFAVVVQALRAAGNPEYLNTQYCWVDLAQTWEVAHTAGRQSRCRARYTVNAAVYWETLIRNTDYTTWNARLGGPQGAFTTTVANALEKSTAGKAWLNSLDPQDRPFTHTRVEEVAWWKQHGLAFFQVQFTNVVEQGISETMSVTSAFGETQALTIKRTAAVQRGALWTTASMYWGPWNDLYFSLAFGYSLVRSDPNHAEVMARQRSTPDHEDALGLPPTYIVQLTRQELGPYGSVDLYIVAPPVSLVKLRRAIHDVFVQSMESDDNAAFRAAFAVIPTLPVDPVPAHWTRHSMMYMGGDPTCPLRMPRPYVQSSFAFDAACEAQPRLSIKLDPATALYAVAASTQRENATFTPQDIPSICAHCAAFRDNCLVIVKSTALAWSLATNPKSVDLQALTQLAVTDVVVAGPKLVQFAVNVAQGDEPVVLDAAMLHDTVASAWDCFGWVYLLEWASGIREVVSFEGDAGTWVLMSDKYAWSIDQVQALEVPRSASRYMWYLSVYVTVVLCAVGGIVVAYGCVVHFRICGWNLVHFNALVGAVWVGRPLLLLRGVTALIVLSTSPITFATTHGVTRFQYSPRGVMDTLVVATEATWLTHVTNDFLHPFTCQGRVVGRLSMCCMWVYCAVMDVWWPFAATARVHPICTPTAAFKIVTCSSAHVEIGSVDRMLRLLAGNGVSVLIAHVVGFISRRLGQRRQDKSMRGDQVGHLLLPGTADVLFTDLLADADPVHRLDQVACVMCGLLCFDRYIFDLKTWTIVKDAAISNRSFKLFQIPKLAHVYSSANLVHTPLARGRWHNYTLLCGMVYMVATVFGSVSYILVSKADMENDFWWATFNSSGAHVHISYWFNDMMLLSPHDGPGRLDAAAYLSDRNATTDPGPTHVSPNYASHVSFASETNTLDMVVRSLRRLDGCLVPWLSTQYCWLDFDRKWPMAHSEARQQRCGRRYDTNAAVYLESVLRNVDWSQLRRCWGESLDTAIATELLRTNEGATWWQAAQSVVTSPADEVSYWIYAGRVTHFTMAWQNYKTIGLVESYVIENALGQSVAMTLKSSNSSFRLEYQTSFKMYWTFASDLWAVVEPTSLVVNKTLIRTSATYAFLNVTMERVLMHNRTIPQPLVRGNLAFHNTIGPYGTVDLRYVPHPESLLKFYFKTQETIFLRMQASTTVREAFDDIAKSDTYNPVPRLWLEAQPPYIVAGGNLLCSDENYHQVSFGLDMLTASTSTCGTRLGNGVIPTKVSTALSVIGSSLIENNPDDLTAASDLVARVHPMKWMSQTRRMIDFLVNTTHFPDGHEPLKRLASDAKRDIYELNVNLAQYKHPAPSEAAMTIIYTRLFEPSQADFDFFSWVFAYEWLMQSREVIAIEGDTSSLVVLSASLATQSGALNPLEIPMNLANYTRFVCIYITAVIIVVALVATLYAISSRFNAEGLNIFELNRVAGIVWVGRPLLFVRSMAAMCLLSTAKLDLVTASSIKYFQEPSGGLAMDSVQSVFKTVLAAGEVSWLVFVVNDIATLYTRQYTASYAVKSSALVWIASAALSFVAPVTHSVSVMRTCSADLLDWQVVCTAGTVTIGSFDRFCLLVGMTVGLTAVCFVWDRHRQPTLRPAKHHSLFLSPSARYLFVTRRWMSDGVYHIDPMSAAINGMVSFRYRDTIYVFDIKTWKVYEIPHGASRLDHFARTGQTHLVHAIPLVE